MREQKDLFEGILYSIRISENGKLNALSLTIKSEKFYTVNVYSRS